MQFSKIISNGNNLFANFSAQVLAEHAFHPFVVPAPAHQVEQFDRGSESLYIQSALNLDTREKTEQEQNSLTRIPDSFKRLIITDGDSLPWHTEEGTEVTGVERWLLE